MPTFRLTEIDGSPLTEGTYSYTNDGVPGTVEVLGALVPVDIAFAVSGAVTQNSARVSVSTVSASNQVRVGYSSAANMAGASFTNYASTDNAALTTTFDLTGLPSDAPLYYRAEAGGTLGPIQSLKTFPDANGSIKMAFGSCGEAGVSTVWGQINATSPDFFFAMGDTPYIDVGTNNPQAFRDAHRNFFASDHLQELIDFVPWVYVWDDHDFGVNNSTSTSASRPAVQAVYREIQPHYPLTEAAAIYTAFDAGPARIISMDLRSDRVAGSDMISATQMAWLKSELTATTAKLIVIVSSVPWISSTDTDTWHGFAAQRTEIDDFILNAGLERRVLMISGDAHMLAYDDGTNNVFNTAGVASFAVAHAAPLNRANSVKGGPYTDGPYASSNRQFMTMETAANGAELDVTITGYSDGTVTTTQSFTTAGGNNLPSAPTILNLTSNSVAEDALAGSAVGVLSSDDPAATFSLVSDVSGNFEVVGSQLRVASGATLTEANTHAITVRASNATGDFDQAFTITVTAAVGAGAFGELVQSTTATDDAPIGGPITTSLTPTLPSVATTGNLIVLTGGPDKGTTPPTAPTNFSTAVNVTNAAGDSAYVFYKISDGTEQAVTLSWAVGARAACTLAEYAGPFDPAPLDVSSLGSEAGDVTTLSSGTTASTTQADVLLVAAAFKESTMSPGGGFDPTEFYGYTSTATFGDEIMALDNPFGDVGTPRVGSSSAVVSSVGTYEVTATVFASDSGRSPDADAMTVWLGAFKKGA